MANQNEQANVTVNLDIAQAAKKLNTLQTELRETKRTLVDLEKTKGVNSDEFKAASLRVKDLNLDIRETKNQLRNKIDIIIDGKTAGATIGNLEAAIRRLSTELKTQLIPGTEEFNQKAARLRELQGHVAGLNSQLKPTQSLFASIKDQIGTIGIAAAGLFGFQFITSQIGNVIAKNAELSDSLADVRKTTNLTQIEVEVLSKSLGKIDTRTSRKELLDLAAEAGKLGISGVANLQKFVEQADKIKVALGDELGEGAITNLGKLSNIFNTEIINIASAVNEIANSSEASAGGQVDFLNRLSGVAPTAKLAADELLGYGATLESLGQTAEVSSGALNSFFIEFIRDTEKFGEVAGFSKGQLKGLLEEKGTNGAFLEFLTKLKDGSTSTEDLLSKLKALGIDGKRDANIFLTLANNIGTVREQQDIANKSIQDGSSVIAEFNTRNETFAAKLDKLGKVIAGAFASSTITKGLESIIDKIVDLSQAAGTVAVAAFDKQSAAVASLEKNTTPLINRYDELSSKTTLSSTETAELDDIIQQIAKTLPTAVTQFDNYGRAISISSDKAREAIQENVKLLQITERSAITELQNNVKYLQELKSATLTTINSGVSSTFKASGSGLSGVREDVKLTATQVTKLQDDIFVFNAQIVEKLTTLQEKFKLNLSAEQKQFIAEYKSLVDKTNTSLTKTATVTESTSSTTENNTINVKANIDDKSIKEAQEKLQKLREDIAKLQTDIADSNLTSDEKQIKSAEDKYDALIARAKGHTKELAAIEALRQQEIAAINNEQAAKLPEKEYKQDIDNLNDFYAQEKALLLQNLADKKITDQQYKDEALALELTFAQLKLQTARDYSRDTVTEETELAQKRIAINDALAAKLKEAGIDITDTTAANYATLTQLIQDLNTAAIAGVDEQGRTFSEVWQQLMDTASASAKKTAEDVKGSLQKNLDSIEPYYQAAKNLANAYFDYITARNNKLAVDDKKQNDKAKANLKSQLDTGKINQEQYTAAIDALDEKAKRAAFDRELKLAKQRKAIAIFEIIIDTAKAVAKSSPNVAQMILAGVLGAVQLATVIAQPLPQYAKGVKQLPGKGKRDGLVVYDPVVQQAVANIDYGEAIIPARNVMPNEHIIDALIAANGKRIHVPLHTSTMGKPSSGFEVSVPPLNFDRIYTTRYTTKYFDGGIFETDGKAAVNKNTTLRTLGVIEPDTDGKAAVNKNTTIRQGIQASDLQAMMQEQRDFNALLISEFRKMEVKGVWDYDYYERSKKELDKARQKR